MKTPLLVHCFLLSCRITERLSGLGGIIVAIWRGCWLGILKTSQLDIANDRAYAADGFYAAAAHNESGLFVWEEDALRSHFQNCKRILLTAAGGGREAVALEKLGYDVDAWESNPQLVESGNRLLEGNGMKTRIREVPYNCFPNSDQPFDGVIIGWGAYNHVCGRENRMQFLGQLKSRVEPGLPILISYTIRRDVFRQNYLVARLVANGIRRLLFRDRLEEGDILHGAIWFHHFSADEITIEFADAGFGQIDLGDYPYGRSILLAQKSP